MKATPLETSGGIPTPHHPKHVEIDNRTLKLRVGLVAIGLPVLTDLLTDRRIHSISESRYCKGPASTIFVGFLFAIPAFLCAHNGHDRRQMFWSKVASLAAALIALFPCECDRGKGLGVHYAAAAVLFGVLTYFCWAFYRRSDHSTCPQAKRRRVVYLLCAIAMVLAILALGAYALLPVDPSRFPQFVSYGEAAGLLAFGVSWMVASRTLPGLTPGWRRTSVAPSSRGFVFSGLETRRWRGMQGIATMLRCERRGGA